MNTNLPIGVEVNYKGIILQVHKKGLNTCAACYFYCSQNGCTNHDLVCFNPDRIFTVKTVAKNDTQKKK